MAMVMKRDRCGAVYDPYEFKNVDHYTIAIIRPYDLNSTIDLCPECTKALNKFANEFKETESDVYKIDEELLREATDEDSIENVLHLSECKYALKDRWCILHEGFEKRKVIG